jgi:ribosomal protein S18 acetylase RimI-like enzyme
VVEPTAIEVRDLRPADVPAAVGVLARGMRDNPLHVAAYGADPVRREKIHGKVVSFVLTKLSAQQPIVALDGDVVVGVAGGTPPGRCQPSAGERIQMVPTLASLGPSTATRILRWIGEWSRHDPEHPHVHLGPVGVDSGRQGQGIGSLLMAEHCRRLDAAGTVGYLETDKDVNVPFYERFGYEVVGEGEVIGVPNWYMERPAPA